MRFNPVGVYAEVRPAKRRGQIVSRWAVWVGDQKADPVAQGFSIRRSVAVLTAEDKKKEYEKVVRDFAKAAFLDLEWANFRSTVARMSKDGEDDFVMENDDAVDTLHRIIDTARGV